MHPRHPLPHVRQRSSWDCGLACAAMVLRAAAASAASTDVDALAAPFSEDRSVWTVDLAVLLASRGVRGLTEQRKRANG